MGPNEAKKAAQRIGETSEKAFRWLLRYAKCDLAKLSEEQRQDLDREVMFFVTEAPPGLKISWNTGRRPRGVFKLDTRLHPHVGFRPTIFWRQRVASLQKRLQGWLHEVMRQHRVSFPPMTLTLSLQHPKFFLPQFEEAELPENFGFYAALENYEQVFDFTVAQIIGAHIGRLRLCHECNEIYLADRRQQVFCSTRCLNRVTQRRWRDRQGIPTKRQKLKSRTKKGGLADGKKRR